MLKSPISRLIARAVLAGATVFVTTLSAADDPFAKSVLIGALTAAVWAALEVFTPLNRSVGK